MISRCKFCKNGFFNTFFPLSHTFYFETHPSPLSKIKKNAFGAHFLQLYRKNEYGDPHFLFHDLNKDSASSYEGSNSGHAIKPKKSKTTSRHRNTLEYIAGKSFLFISLKEKFDLTLFSVRRSQYFISHTKSHIFKDRL